MYGGVKSDKMKLRVLFTPLNRNDIIYGEEKTMFAERFSSCLKMLQ